MLSLTKLSQSFGGKPLFEEASVQCRPGERYGVVGKNGAGKSTLLQVIAGEIPPTEGTIDLPAGSELGLLKQDHFVYESWRLLDVVIAGKPKLWAAMEEKIKIYEHTEFTDEDGVRLGELEEIVMAENGYEAESFAHTLLSGLGLEQEKHDQPLSSLSGGFKLRVLLTQVLYQEPNALLLDETTNHLDITSNHWLEENLIYEFKGTLLFVSHDKHFLNSVSSHILDIDYGTITDYTGNFDAFLLTKSQAEDQRKHARKLQEAKVDQLQQFVSKFGAKASKAKQAKSKQKQIDRMEMTEVKVSNRGAPYFNFKQVRPSGKQVLNVKDIEKSFAELKVLHNIIFEVFRGEKVAIIGPNGMGKSTLLKILMKQLEACQGEFEWGYETHVGYFAQDHHEQLQGNKTVQQWLEDEAPHNMRDSVRSYLGQMLFSGDSVDKKIKNLSGGEAGRLLLAGLMINQGNVLILDEPTNHLDLEAITGLMEALRKFEGTVLFVSHDRDFVRALATRIIVLTPQGLEDVTAGYDEYLNASGEDYLTREKAKPEPSKKKSKKGKKGDTAKSAEKQLQHKIANLENELITIDDQMANPALYESDDGKDIIAELGRERQKIQSQIDQLLNEWETLSNDPK